MPDSIDGAIKAAEADQSYHQINLTISGTGRMVSVRVPADLLIGELLEFLSWAPVGIMAELQRLNNPKSRLVLPNTPIPNLLVKS